MENPWLGDQRDVVAIEGPERGNVPPIAGLAGSARDDARRLAHGLPLATDRQGRRVGEGDDDR